MGKLNTRRGCIYIKITCNREFCVNLVPNAFIQSLQYDLNALNHFNRLSMEWIRYTLFADEHPGIEWHLAAR